MQELSLGDVDLLLAIRAFEITDDFSFYVLLEALIQSLEVLDGEAEIVELLDLRDRMFAL